MICADDSSKAIYMQGISWGEKCRPDFEPECCVFPAEASTNDYTEGTPT
jgi:hypothetical protein